MSIDRIDATPVPAAAPAIVERRDVSRPRRTSEAELFLTWVDPVVTGELHTPSGLAIGNAGRRAAHDVSVDSPAGESISAARLARSGRLLVASVDEPGSIAAVVTTGTVFVDWTDRNGDRRTDWLRVPPLPARFSARA
ncbi:hypothetical protein CLV49_1787 [Labedella gwakjiensis]|uniref:Uncharacterized protein n=1 Tax=Labedella gwakjiensis TaxID=390269 RepID=A0A2P8GW34_9MICO|nr:hypothetical protein [Labedella gwakjiensis]PSL38173.1 hypothetical protein CLV49_1787 [Labedella gwakjiensis]RUQ87280.1 hypothetical protein ELQ93_10270 [Labedella gwakjiensis]